MFKHADVANAVVLGESQGNQRYLTQSITELGVIPIRSVQVSLILA